MKSKNSKICLQEGETAKNLVSVRRAKVQSTVSHSGAKSMPAKSKNFKIRQEVNQSRLSQESVGRAKFGSRVSQLEVSEALAQCRRNLTTMKPKVKKKVEKRPSWATRKSNQLASVAKKET